MYVQYFYSTVFAKIDGGPCHERPREIMEDMPLFIRSIFSEKTEFSTMREIILFGKYL